MTHHRGLDRRGGRPIPTLPHIGTRTKGLQWPWPGIWPRGRYTYHFLFLTNLIACPWSLVDPVTFDEGEG